MLASIFWSFLAFALLAGSLLCFSVLGIFLFKGRLGTCRDNPQVMRFQLCALARHT
jgi:hypothetical protein